MSFKSAQLFVDEMKGNSKFRNLMASVENDESLMALLKEKGYTFNQKDLVSAMAECMTEMAAMMEKQTM